MPLERFLGHAFLVQTTLVIAYITIIGVGFKHLCNHISSGSDFNAENCASSFKYLKRKCLQCMESEGKHSKVNIFINYDHISRNESGQPSFALTMLPTKQSFVFM